MSYVLAHGLPLWQDLFLSTLHLQLELVGLTTLIEPRRHGPQLVHSKSLPGADSYAPQGNLLF